MVNESGEAYASFGNILWFTNLDIKKRHEELILVRRYKGHEDEYPMYDNYAAINVDKVKDIPEDYMGAMGVPITFLDKYCPDQFEILNCNDYKRSDDVRNKPHGIVKDKEASITVENRERESTHNLCANPYQEAMIWLPVQRLLEGRSTAASSLEGLRNMVAAYAGIAPEDVPFSDAIGVPITFLDKYCPNQFEIIGASDNGAVEASYKLPHVKKHNEPYVQGSKKYKRIFIRRKRQEAAKQPTQQSIVSTN